MRYFNFKICCVLCLIMVNFLSGCSSSDKNIRLDKEWETLADLKEPESVIYDSKENVIYVSNINNPAGGKDGNGSIGRISLEGDILEVDWVIGGMDAPKGLGLLNELLYVADLNNIVVINTKNGKLQKTIEVKDSGMLNDITIDDEGNIYVSDSDNKRIYQIINDIAEIWLEKDFFQKPNGLLAHQGKIYMIDMDSGIFYEINKDTKALRKIAEGLVGGDGIIPFGDNFIISNWHGELNLVKSNGDIKMLIDTKADNINAADIAYIPKHNLLLVSTFFNNKVVAYKILE